MRILYLDEAGTGDPAREPFVVVSGVLVSADTDWKKIEAHLLALANRLAPPAARADFVFHATEIFSGGKRFPKDECPPPKRWPILDALVSIPGQFRLPVVMGFAKRSDPYPTISQDIRSEEHLEACLQTAFLMCMQQAERVMREFMKDELAMVIMESSKPRMHAAYVKFQKFLRNRDLVESIPGYDSAAHHLPLRHIIENPTFSPKSDSNPLQIADACAFAIKRHLMGAHECERFYQPLTRWMVARPVSDLSSAMEQQR